jgi:hypothetical protein
VFDSNFDDWLRFLKGQNLYTGNVVPLDASDLNSASIAIGDMPGAQTVSRTALSVGSKSETYTFSTSGLSGISATPSVTSFTAAPGSSTPWTVRFLNTGTPLNTYSKGFIIWTGNQGHVVKMAVAIRPVKFQAPAEVNGTGTTGSLTYDGKAGYNGTLDYSIRGLQAAADASSKTLGTDPDCNFNTATPDAMVAATKANVSSFTTPANANYVRFQTFAADASASAHDLDMFVYRAPPAPAAETYSLIASSGGPDANEFVGSTSTLLTTPGTRLKVYIHACNVDAPGGSYVLNSWALTSPSSHPFTTVPASRTVAVGDVIPTTFGWTGLPAGNRYLGRVQTVDPTAPTVAMSTTLVFVNTR